MSFLVSRTYSFLLALIIAICLVGGSAFAAEQPVRQTSMSLKVVELFTSQGCPKAPKGDANVARLKSSRSDVLVLSFPVTYWDYLGWKDTNAKPAFDERQKHYNDHLADPWLYTPQAVVQGQIGVTAEDYFALDRALYEVSSKESHLPQTQRQGDMLKLSNMFAEVSYQAVFFEKEATIVSVKKGKNAGKDLSYVNLVRGVVSFDNDQLTIPATMADKACAVLARNSRTGKIFSAAYCAD